METIIATIQPIHLSNIRSGSDMLNVLNIGADDGRKTTHLTEWKNPKNKKL